MKERMKALKESLANVQDRYRDSGDTELLVILDTLQLILNGFEEATGDEKLRQLMRAERKGKYDSPRKNWGTGLS